MVRNCPFYRVAKCNGTIDFNIRSGTVYFKLNFIQQCIGPSLFNIYFMIGITIKCPVKYFCETGIKDTKNVKQMNATRHIDYFNCLFYSDSRVVRKVHRNKYIIKRRNHSANVAYWS